MKKFAIFYYLVFGLVILSFQGCSLSVKRNVVIRDLPSQDTSLPITIYIDTSNIPKETKFIGSLFIGDAGATIRCDSALVFDRARVETRRVGGNALLLTHYTKPSYWGSSCHQIRGIMLYVPDPLPNNDIPVAGLSNSTSLDETVTTISQNNADAINKLVARNKERKLDIAVFGANIGYGWRVAEMRPDVSIFEKEKWEAINDGFVGSLSANYFFNDMNGMGLFFQQYNASYNTLAINDMGQSGTFEAKTNIIFIGPAFVTRYAFGQNNSWILVTSVGLGYMGYEHNESFLQDRYKESGSTVGILASIGLDHKLNDNWGIGANFLWVNGIVFRIETYENGYKETHITSDANEGVGIGQINLKVGVRYFINPPKKQ